MSRPLLNVPEADLQRTPIGRRLSALAAESGLFLHHFEHRVHLPLPEHWLPDDRPDLGAPAVWQGGVLGEARYQHFRLDAMVGAFDPGHRGQSTLHELCRRLVGFAWRPHATPLFLTLAARLSEVLPKTLGHFFEEAERPRCPAHVGQGPLFGRRCEACERGGLPADAADRDRMRAAGLRLMERELAAIAASRRTGRCEPNGWATLDMAGDGLAYTAAHLQRLHSHEMAEFVSLFFAPEQGHHTSLDALEARVLAVRDALLDGAPLTPWRADAARWVAQDLGWRLLQVRAECDPSDAEGSPYAGLSELIEALADGGEPAAAFAAYTALHADFILPEPEDVFGVGYGLPGVPGRSLRQVKAGLESVLPGTLALLDAGAGDDGEVAASVRPGEAAVEAADDGADATIADFLEVDAALRMPLGRRFAAYLRETRPGPVADLATYEAAIAHPPAPDPEATTLGVAGARDRRMRRSQSFELLRFGCDVLALAQALDAVPPAEETDGLAGHEPDADLVNRPICLLVGRPALGELVITDVTSATADALERMGSQAVEPGAVGLPKGEAAALEAIGVLVPAAWKVE